MKLLMSEKKIKREEKMSNLTSDNVSITGFGDDYFIIRVKDLKNEPKFFLCKGTINSVAQLEVSDKNANFHNGNNGKSSDSDMNEKKEASAAKSKMNTKETSKNIIT